MEIKRSALVSVKYTQISSITNKFHQKLKDKFLKESIKLNIVYENPIIWQCNLTITLILKVTD